MLTCPLMHVKRIVPESPCPWKFHVLTSVSKRCYLSFPPPLSLPIIIHIHSRCLAIETGIHVVDAAEAGTGSPPSITSSAASKTKKLSAAFREALMFEVL